MKKVSTLNNALFSGLLMLLVVLPLAGRDNRVDFEDDDTLEEIREKIRNNGYRFTVDHNWVFDMSPEEKRAFFSRRPPREQMGMRISDEIGPLAEYLGRSLPAKFDWRDVDGHTYIGPVRNQGSCGSCYAFGAAAAAEGTYNKALGLTDGACADFSESFIMWCLGSLSEYNSHFYGCDGADWDYVELDALVDLGICSESDYPYTIIEPSSCTHWDDPRVQFQSWHRVPCGDIEAIKMAIYVYGVVDAAVYVSSGFSGYSGGIYDDTLNTCSSTPCYYTYTNHAIALVGWDDAEGVFYLRNSWGESWGEDGYMRITYDAARVHCEATYLVYTIPDTLTVTAPDGGEEWEVGTQQSITWDSTGSVGNVKIEYSINNGGSWDQINDDTENDGVYAWTIPDTTSTQCLVRVSSLDDAVTDVSDGVFTIRPLLVLGYDDAGRAVALQNSGYLIAGSSNGFSNGGYDFLLYRLNASGTVTWQRHYGGWEDDAATAVAVGADGRGFLAGNTESFTHGGSDILIYRLQTNGAILWEKYFGGSEDDRACSIAATADGGAVVAGTSESYTHGQADFVVYKLNASGNRQWRRNYGGAAEDLGHTLAPTPDGGYVLGGWTETYTHGQGDLLVYKLNSAGSKEWRKNLGGEGNEFVEGNPVVQPTADGGYVVAGSSDTYTHGDDDFLVYKLNSSGKKAWRKNYGGTDLDRATAVYPTSEGGFIIAGYSRSYSHGGDDFLLYKVNASGNKVWRKNFGGTGDDLAWGVVPLSDGGFVVVGETLSYVTTPGYRDILVYRLGASGAKLWRKNMGR
jgi:uncharacterized delta-60 repeat protein